jgi:hypothetical protein
MFFTDTETKMTAIEQIRPFWKSILDFWKIYVTGSLFAVALFFWTSFGGPVPYWFAGLILASTLVLAVLMAGRNEHQERLALAEKLEPKLEILDDAEIDESQHRCRIRVKSLSDSPVRFGVELKEMLPPMPGAPLPFTLRITQEGNEPIGYLPARQTRTIDVAGFSAHRDSLRFFGIGSSTAEVQINPYKITICCHSSDKEGAVAEKKFIVVPTGNVPGLRAI